MLAWSHLIVAVILFLLLATVRAKSVLWTVSYGLLLLEATYFSKSMLFTWVGWPIFAIYVVATYVPSVRRRYLSNKVFTFFKRVLPPVSPTEQAAINAGDIWWEAQMFRGHPDWQQLFAMPKPTLTVEEQSFLDNEVMQFCELLDEWKIISQDQDMSKAAWDYLRENRFFALNTPKQYGGLGFSALAQSSIVSRIGTRSVAGAVTTMVPNSLGPAELLVHYGTQEQKDEYLPSLVSGERIPCFALTSPDAGSDAGAIPDKGIVCMGTWQGKEMLGMRLTWNKRYITLAPVATLLGLAFKLYDPDSLLGSEQNLGITVCLIPTETPGVEIGDRHNPLGTAFMNGPTSGTDVFVPLDWIIGGPKMAGQGWQMLMECLSEGRGISLPALSAATGQMTYRMTGAYASMRKQFNLPIGKFEGVEEALARIAGRCYLLEATRRFTTSAIDMNLSPAVATAMAKYHMTEWARTSLLESMDVHAGRGIMLGPNNYLANGYMGSPISITVEGANILTRSLIIFGQGAIRCHPYILKEMQAVELPDQRQAKIEFDRMLTKHVAYSISNAVRAFVFGLIGGPIAKPEQVHPRYHVYTKQLTRMSSALSICSDIAMLVLGGQLKRKERLSARLGDVLSYLYIASGVMKYHQDEATCAEDDQYLEWSMNFCLWQMQGALSDFFANFPNPIIGKALNWLIFPLGKRIKPPSDKLEHAIVSPMLLPTGFRERLTSLCFVGCDNSKGVAMMELAFQKMVQAMPAEQKVNEAIKLGLLERGEALDVLVEIALEKGILNAEEATSLMDYDAIRQKVVAVDSFKQSDFNQGADKSCQNNSSSRVA